MRNIEILLVEDSAEFRDILERRLMKEAPQFKVHIVEGGEECLRFASEHPVDCILSDYQMPSMNGLELFKKLRTRGDDTPFILITGQGTEDVAREALKSGAYDYFSKDGIVAQIPRIVNSVEQAVNHRQTQRMVKAAELALLEEKNRLEAVLASIGEAISIQDTEFRVLYQNPAHSRLVGRHAGEFCYKAYVRKDNVCDDCHLARCFEDGKIHTSVKTRNTPQGVEYLEIMGSPVIDTSGRIVAGIESIRDITDRKKAEQERIRLLKGVSASRDGIALNDKDDRYVFVNEAYANIFGYTPEELAGKSWKNITPPEMIPKGEDFMRRVLHNRDVGEFNAEFPGLRKDGTQVPTDVTATAIWDDDGNYNGHVCIVRDITEKKKLERERADFYAMVTHDLKSPISVITGYAEMLASSGACAQDEDMVGMVDGIKRSAGKVVNLIDDFLTVSRMDSGKLAVNLSVQDLAVMLEDVREEFSTSAHKKGLSLALDVSGELPPLLLDRRLVHRAVANLIQNAVGYTPRGGEVLLKAYLEKTDGTVNAVVSVTDNGPGIPSGEQGRVFEMYYRSPNVSGTTGTGLGLSVVRAAAQAHGGRVELESEPGKGSTFSIVLPVLPLSQSP